MPQLMSRAVMWWWAIGLAILALLFNTAWKTPTTQRKPSTALPALAAQLNATSVSGISSGAYMAGQFQMAHAPIVTGAAIIAGGPYGCSESVFADQIPGPGTAFLNLTKAVNGCMLDMLGAWGVADPQKLANKAKDRAMNGEIAAIAEVVTDKVYLFTGSSDRTVVPSIVKSAAAFYEKLGLPKDSIKLVSQLPAGHAFVTETEGASCERSGEPYVVDCDYDQAGDLLRHIYGTLAPRSTNASGQFLEFDQAPYRIGQMPNGLDDRGVVYVPQACQQGACRIHIAFHGCAQNREKVGDAFVKRTGFANWADSNQLIVLFPQVATTLSNPQACWDWWGYTGHDYLTLEAPQIRAVRAMIDALATRPQS